MVNFVDYKTNYCRVFVAKTKDTAAKKFEHFLSHFERRFECRVLVLRTDGGREYNNVDLFCATTGIARQVTEANSSASNGKAERMHRTIMNMARCMLFNCGLPMRFWGDAVKYAAYVLNRSPSRSNPRRQSPIEMLEGAAPNLMSIVTFGSPCMVFQDTGTNSLRKRASRALILGRSEETKGYVVYLLEAKKVTITQHVKSIETLSTAQNQSLLANSGVFGDVPSDVGNDSVAGPLESPPPWVETAHKYYLMQTTAVFIQLKNHCASRCERQPCENRRNGYAMHRPQILMSKMRAMKKSVCSMRTLRTPCHFLRL